MIPLKFNAADDISDLDAVHPMGAFIAVTRADATIENARMPVPFRKFSGENYESVQVFVNLYQITEVLYDLRRSWTSTRKSSGTPLNATVLITLEVSSPLHFAVRLKVTINRLRHYWWMMPVTSERNDLFKWRLWMGSTDLQRCLSRHLTSKPTGGRLRIFVCAWSLGKTDNRRLHA